MTIFNASSLPPNPPHGGLIPIYTRKLSNLVYPIALTNHVITNTLTKTILACLASQCGVSPSPAAEWRLIVEYSDKYSVLEGVDGLDYSDEQSSPASASSGISEHGYKWSFVRLYGWYSELLSKISIVLLKCCPDVFLFMFLMRNIGVKNCLKRFSNG